VRGQAVIGATLCSQLFDGSKCQLILLEHQNNSIKSSIAESMLCWYSPGCFLSKLIHTRIIQGLACSICMQSLSTTI